MPLIVISGPEGAGKTTLAKTILKEKGVYRHWSGDAPLERYAEPLREDIARVFKGELVVWDRSWVCDTVYAKLLHRKHRAVYYDPGLGQDCFGGAVDSLGLQLVLLPRAPVTDRREDDLVVDPKEELEAYKQYGLDHRILTLIRPEGEELTEELARKLVFRARARLLIWAVGDEGAYGGEATEPRGSGRGNSPD